MPSNEKMISTLTINQFVDEMEKIYDVEGIGYMKVLEKAKEMKKENESLKKQIVGFKQEGRRVRAELELRKGMGSDKQEKRRDLLAVIQNARDRDQADVLYDSNSLIFIDLNNAYPLPLRNLQFRIINSDESTVDVQGYSNMTILIQS